MLSRMTSSRHTPEQIASFSEGEPRFIAAAYRDAGRASELFVMPDGRASELREFTREHLRCLIPDCSAPNVVAVARSRRRDGFSHKAGGGKHAPESVHHRQGKAVLAEWLRSRVGRGAVAVESATDTQRSRVADVLVTFPGGARLAFEVQYAAITVAAWRERHESYRAQGIVDVWLWGHTRLKKSRTSYDPPFRLDDVQDEMRTGGLPVHWFNPEIGELATAVTISQPHDVAIAIDRRFGDILLQRLTACGVTPDGIQSGLLRELSVQTAAWRAAIEQHRLEQEQKEASLQELRRRRLDEDFQRIAELRRASEQSITTRTAALAQRPAHTSPPKPGTTACRACGKTLDPILAGTGYHVLCDPNHWRR